MAEEEPPGVLGCWLASMPSTVQWGLPTISHGVDKNTWRKLLHPANLAFQHTSRASFLEAGVSSRGDNVLLAAVVLQPKFRTLPWLDLNAEQACQVRFWAKLTGMTNLQLLFFHVFHARQLPEPCRIVECGPKRKARSFDDGRLAGLV